MKKGVRKENSTFEEFKAEVFRVLKNEYINFREPCTKEAQELMNSEEVAEIIKKEYEDNEPANMTAWGIDLLL